MKHLRTILIVVTLMCLTVIGVHPDACASGGVGKSIYSVSPEDIFLKGYHAKGDSIWVRIHPPMMQGQTRRIKKGLMGLLKNVIEGIYIRFEGEGNPKDLILCELKPDEEKGESRSTKNGLDTSSLSSLLSMTAQFYDEAAKSFRTGRFKRSKNLPPNKKILIVIPVNKSISVKIWFDTKEKQWILYGSDRPNSKDLSLQLIRLTAFLRSVSNRSARYINEIYYLDFSKDIPRVTEVETHVILPPGHPGSVSTHDLSRKAQAEEHGLRLSGYLMKAFGRGEGQAEHVGLPRNDLLPSQNKQDQSGTVKKVPLKMIDLPAGLLSLKKRHGTNGMVFLRSFGGEEIREAHKIAVFPDPYVNQDNSDSVICYLSLKSHYPYASMELSRRQTLDTIASRQTEGLLYFPGHNFGHKTRSLIPINGQMDLYGLSGFYYITGPEGPELNLSTGILVGMGLGIEAATLGTSLLPAGGITVLSNISALVGGATVLTGGVVIAAIAAGASIQYFFHLQDNKVERKRIEYLLDSVARKISERQLD